MEALWLLITGVVGVVIGATFIYWYLSPRILPPKPSHESQVLSMREGGYYWSDLANKKEQCSPGLRQLLGLENFRFDDILQRIEEPHRIVLTQALRDLESGKNNILLHVNTLDGNIQLECMLTGNYDARNRLRQVTIWFRDVTTTQRQYRRLMKENEKLKQDIKQFSNILNVLPTPIWLRGEDLTIRYCNLAYSEAAEESPERSAEQGALELHSQAQALAKHAYDTAQTVEDRRHIIIGGARKLYHFTETPMTSDKIVVGIAQDITELEGTREELQRHIHAQSDLLESVTSAMAVFGADTKLKFFNNAFIRLWGLDEAWLDTEPTYGEWLETLREKRRLPEQANFPQFKQQYLKLFTDLIEPREEIFYLPDGRTLRVLAIPHALGGILFAYEDVTDRLALERSYNTLIAVQKATLDNLNEGVVVFGEDGRLRLTNPRFLQLWHLQKAVLSPETHMSDLIEKTKLQHHYEDWSQYKANFIAHLLSREVQYRRIECTDGSVVDSVVVPLPDGATLVTFSDVTAAMLVERSLRERNEALQEADRLKTEFLANVSYELRSPLTSISGFAEMLKQDYFGALSAKQREYVGGIHEASQHLMHLINDILDISSIEAGYMKLDVSEFDIHSALQSVISLVSERMREHKLKFTFDCSRRIGKILADETRMKQIMFNLLSNAIKYSEAGGTVTLSVQAVPAPEVTQGEVIFTIEDTGIGISPDEQQAVFGKFYKGSNIGAQKSGTGLGLSMVKSFIELHGGRVELISAPGLGTKVICYLPRRNPNLLEHLNTKVA